ncbi:MAG: Rhomboid family protein [Frankiales bacterium]|nr:Rhomboid family protein [Frankiales bacterium]
MRSASVGFQCPSCVKDGAATVRQAQAAYGGRARGRPDVTFTLIGLNVLVFLITTVTGTGLVFGGNPSSIFEKLALAPTDHVAVQNGQLVIAHGVAQGEYYRLLTSMFLHFGIIHIALNMYCLFLLGPALEQAFGRLRFAAVYLVSGLSGAALSYLLGPPNEQAAGASGAVFGLFAAFFVLQRRRGGDVTQIATVIGINLAFSVIGSSFIDWRGHVGGLIGGALVAAAIVYAPAGPRRWLYQAVGTAAVVLVVVGVVVVRTAQLTAA